MTRNFAKTEVEAEKEVKGVEGANISPSNDVLSVGGRLMNFSSHWISSKWGHSVVSKGLGWKWIKTPPLFKRFYQPSTQVLEDYVQQMLQKGVIEPCRSLKFQGRLFSVPKKDSLELRTILDLSPLNKFIDCPTFKMTTVSQVRTLLPLGFFTSSIDLKDAYWHVPVSRTCRPFLGFALGRNQYRFKAMPFGLNIAPRVFTKLTAVI